MGSLWVRSSRGAVRGRFNGEEFDRKRAGTSAVRVEAEVMGTLSAGHEWEDPKTEPDGGGVLQDGHVGAGRRTQRAGGRRL